MIIIGLIFGVAIHQIARRYRVKFWPQSGRPFINPNWPGRRLQYAISALHRFLRILPGAYAALLGIALTTFHWILLLNIGGGILLGYVASAAAFYELSDREDYRIFRWNWEWLAARNTVLSLPAEEAEARLLWASKQKNSGLRLAAARFLQQFPNENTIEAMQRLSQDKVKIIAHVARNGHVAMENALAQRNILSVAKLKALVEEHQVLLQQTKSPEFEKGATFRKLVKVEEDLSEIVNSQWVAKQAFPHIFCLKCYAHAEKSSYDHWEWVACRMCSEAADLKTDVQNVIGQIGGVETFEHDGQTLRINLWNDQTQKARGGDINTLEIVGSQPINYDWGVNAVLEQLSKRNLDEKSIQLQLTDTPTLDKNTLLLLRGFLSTTPPSNITGKDVTA
jgi:hypothetical protein